jgi:hypothetical protein
VIVGSVLLILIAIVLLGFGLTGNSDAPLFGSIGASLLAAVALYVGARQTAAERAVDGDEYEQFEDELAPAWGEEKKEAEHVYATVGVATGSAAVHAESTRKATRPTMTQTVAEPLATETGTATATAERIPTQAGPPDEPAAPEPLGDTAQDEPADEADEDGGDEYQEPPDEPPAQHVSPADAVRVSQLSVDVVVIDGRPRYHLADCDHLLRKDSEPLPVGEAVELGFTPCSLCEPDRTLLAEAGRV